jgi:predicted metal-dependent phosphoesterase TrpH
MVMTWRADLHTHSTCSDGSLTPQQLLQAAIEAGCSGLSITDHDCVEAYDQLGWPEASPSGLGMARSIDGVLLVPGLELSTQLEGESIHLLAYAFDPSHSLIRETCAERKIQRRERYLEMRQRLRQLGLPLATEIDLPDQVLGRPQLAGELVALGLCTSYHQAFQRYLSDRGPAYVPGKSYPLAEGIELLREAGAWVILAHPMLVPSHLIERVLSMPIDGVEAFYGRHHHKAAQWLDLAQKRGWLATGGSDFHGAPRPNVRLGQSWVGEEVFQAIATPPGRTRSSS